jgi:Holliday junction resolvase RusA-like endonuclease
MIMVLVIPKLQHSLNILLRQHWAPFHREQDIFDLLVAKEYREKHKPKNFKGRTVGIVYTLYFKDRQKRDLSNYGQKMLDDSLVKEGIIDDDNSTVILQETVRIRYDKDNPRTEIIIADMIKEVKDDAKN